MPLSLKLLGISVVAVLATGCATETAAGGSEEVTDTADFTSREGYTPIKNARGGVYVSVAAYGQRAYLGDNEDGIDIVDLVTMKKTGSLEGRIPAYSLSVSGGLLASCGDRDDQPHGWDAVYGASDRNYTITLFDAKTGKKQREISLRLQQYIESASGGFIDLPTMTCQLDAAAKSLSVSFSVDELTDEIVTFPLPEASVSYDFRHIPNATRQTVGSNDDNTVKGFSSGPYGLTYAAGGYGLRRIAPNQTATKTIRNEGKEHLVGVAERGARLFAADHNGALLVLDAENGATVESIAVGDWLQGVAIADQYVLVIGRAGLMVAKDRWSR